MCTGAWVDAGVFVGVGAGLGGCGCRGCGWVRGGCECGGGVSVGVGAGPGVGWVWVQKEKTFVSNRGGGGRLSWRGCGDPVTWIRPWARGYITLGPFLSPPRSLLLKLLPGLLLVHWTHPSFRP